ncbi:putative DsbA family dithiol-disulfide isomerase [Pacificimonas flava]|nr:putative DsbA family dithiol-disulfide isomerase [Pacificimonas flava]
MNRRALMRMKFGADGPSPAMQNALTGALEEAGLSVDFTAIERVPNTLNAHRLMLWAEGQAVADIVAESLFQAYFADALDIGDPHVLTRIGAAAGLDPEILADLLAGDRDQEVVEARAADMLDRGIPGVPAQMIGRRSLLVGAQSPAALEDAIVAAS